MAVVFMPYFNSSRSFYDSLMTGIFKLPHLGKHPIVFSLQHTVDVLNVNSGEFGDFQAMRFQILF